jgi:predicted Fe-Mo cluster-binding NifX family protein
MRGEINRLSKMRLAIPTKGTKGLDDVVSDVFGKARSFAIIEVAEGSITGVEVASNPAAKYKHGAGPIAIKTLTEKGVTAVAARELGLGASTLLDQNKITKYKVKSGISVKKAVETVLKEAKA